MVEENYPTFFSRMRNKFFYFSHTLTSYLPQPIAFLSEQKKKKAKAELIPLMYFYLSPSYIKTMFLEFKKEVEHVLKEALEKASYEYKELEAGLDLEESEHADIASRIAFPLARACKQPPKSIAENIVSRLEIPAENTLISNAVALSVKFNACNTLYCNVGVVKYAL